MKVKVADWVISGTVHLTRAGPDLSSCVSSVLTLCCCHLRESEELGASSVLAWVWVSGNTRIIICSSTTGQRWISYYSVLHAWIVYCYRVHQSELWEESKL